MVQGLFRHRQAPVRSPWSWRDASRQAQARWDRLAHEARTDPRLFLWRACWLPFWVASDTPVPDLPSRRPSRDRAAFADPAGAWLAAHVDRTVRSFGLAWMAGSLLRGFTLALLAITFWILLAVIGVVSLPGWAAAGAIISLGVAIGGAYGWLAWPDRMMVAAMLDRTFGLRERIVSAFDRPQNAGHVSRLQLADAANTFDDVMTDVPRATFVPVREAAICLIVAGALVTMLLAYVPRQGIAPIANAPVPQFVPASERLAAQDDQIPPQQPPGQSPDQSASIAQIQEQSRESRSTRDDLARLGEALQDHPITQPAAAAIANGDYGSAAESLRAASKAASTMSQEERDALADDLEQAAQQISESNPELAQAANDAAEALRKGGPEAESALADLADQVDQAADKVQSPGEQASNLDEAQTGEPGDGSSESGDKQGEPSQSQGGEEQQQDSQQNASDPGEGSSAQPGVSNQEQQSSEPGASDSESSQGSSDEGGGSSDSPPESGDQSSEGAQQGDGSGGSSTDASQGDGSSNEQPMQGAPDEETSAGQGSGAGTGQEGANDQTTDGGQNDSASDPSQLTPEADAPGSGEAGDPPASREDRGEEDDNRGTDSEGSSTLELQGASDSGVETGGDSGSSSLGSGTGSSTASGDQAQTEVGVAGPDSNVVPDALRDVVKDYFEGPQP